jgi:pSer/pThr/pTyr-binding forkhead associated (FHA) protein
MTGWILTSTEPEILLRIPAGETKTLGRTARADFVVDAALVSRVHCRLASTNEEQLTVEDLGSTNGTLVNGERVDQSVLRTGDTLTVGRVTFTITPA